MKNQADSLQKEADKYRKILAQKSKTLSQLNRRLAELAKRYGAKTKTLESIYKEKVDYRLKSGIFYTLAKDLSKFEVYVDKMYTHGDTVWLSMVGEDDRRITEFIKYISDVHFNDIKSIDIEMIAKDPKSKIYRGLLKVELR